VIDMALLSVIRRWHFREGMPIREIERRTGLSRNTIRKYLRSGAVEPRFKVPERPSKLDPLSPRCRATTRPSSGVRLRSYALSGGLSPKFLPATSRASARLRCYPSVDAPEEATGKFGYVAVVGCCHLSGLLMRRIAAGPYGSSRTGTTSTISCS